MSYTFISPTGQIIRTRTIKEFAQTHGFRYSNAKSLACGLYQSLHGWTSMHSKARKRRLRITTVLVNTRTGVRKTLGKFVTTFARENGLSIQRLYRLVNRRRLAYKDWMLADTYEAALGAKPDSIL